MIKTETTDDDYYVCSKHVEIMLMYTPVVKVINATLSQNHSLQCVRP